MINIKLAVLRQQEGAATHWQILARTHAAQRDGLHGVADHLRGIVAHLHSVAQIQAAAKAGRAAGAHVVDVIAYGRHHVYPHVLAQVG